MYIFSNSSTINKENATNNKSSIIFPETSFLQQHKETLLPLIEKAMNSGNLKDTLQLCKTIENIEATSLEIPKFVQKLKQHVNNFDLQDIENTLKILYNKTISNKEEKG